MMRRNYTMVAKSLQGYHLFSGYYTFNQLVDFLLRIRQPGTFCLCLYTSSAPHNQQSTAQDSEQRSTVAIKDKPENQNQAQIIREIYVVRHCAYVHGEGENFFYESEDYKMITIYFT